MGLFGKKKQQHEELHETVVMDPIRQDNFGQTEVKPVVDEVLPVEDLTEDQPAPDTTEVVNVVADEMGVIAQDTIIVGSVATKGHIVVDGIVEGDVTASGNILLTGNVKGHITCNNLVIDGSQLYSSVTATGSVSIKENTSINGDILCKHISVMGMVVGNITASGNVGLTQTAVINGDITASALAVEPGAKLKGSIIIK